MTYAERSFFDGDYCQHCADRDEHLRLRRIARNAQVAFERRKGSRGIHRYSRLAA
jgi:hypothetical protein